MNNVRKIALSIAVLGSVVMVTKPATTDDASSQQAAACQKLVNDFQYWEKTLLNNLYGIQATWRASTGYTLAEPGQVIKDRNLLGQYFTASNAFRDWYGQQYMPAQAAYQASMQRLGDACTVKPKPAKKQVAKTPKKSGRRVTRAAAGKRAPKKLVEKKVSKKRALMPVQEHTYVKKTVIEDRDLDTDMDDEDLIESKGREDDEDSEDEIEMIVIHHDDEDEIEESEEIEAHDDASELGDHSGSESYEEVDEAEEE